MKVKLQRICHCNLNLHRKIRCNLKPFATDYALQIKIKLQRMFRCKFQNATADPLQSLLLTTHRFKLAINYLFISLPRSLAPSFAVFITKKIALLSMLSVVNDALLEKGQFKITLQRIFRCNLKPFAMDYPLQIKITVQWIFRCNLKLLCNGFSAAIEICNGNSVAI